MMPSMTIRGVVMAALVCVLSFGLGCGVGVGVFLVVDRLFDAWPHEPPYQWVGPLLLLTYGCGLVGVVAGAWWQWRLRVRVVGRQTARVGAAANRASRGS